MPTCLSKNSSPRHYHGKQQQRQHNPAKHSKHPPVGSPQLPGPRMPEQQKTHKQHGNDRQRRDKAMQQVGYEYGRCNWNIKGRTAGCLPPCEIAPCRPGCH